MASTKLIRKRISSVKNTQKITKAMKMVSAAKLRRAMEKAEASRPYESELSSMVGAALEETAWNDPIKEVREAKRTAIVVVSTDRGLCGSLNSNLFKSVIRKLEAESLGDVEIYALGKKSRDFFKRRGFKIGYFHGDLVRKSSYEEIESISKTLVERFLSSEIDRVFVFYSQFKSALLQEPQSFQLLPFTEAQIESKTKSTGYIFEPKGPELLKELVPMLIYFRLYRAVLESLASEHAARMTAMDSATKNAKDMIGSLTLQMNRARQAAITKELMEIIGGAEAISA